jgi:uncharacterized protein (TIGR02588 family)
MNRDDGKESSESSEPSPLEIIATMVAAIIVLAILAVLGWDATRRNLPAAFEVKIDSAAASGSAYRAYVDVRNTGDEAAKSVVVHVELAGKDTTYAESDVTIDWLPGRSARKAVAYFPAMTREGVRVKAEVHGYVVP